jgi:hypothetical protein
VEILKARVYNLRIFGDLAGLGSVLGLGARPSLVSVAGGGVEGGDDQGGQRFVIGAGLLRESGVVIFAANI